MYFKMFCAVAASALAVAALTAQHRRVQITVQIIMRATGPVVTVTMHSWGDATVTFPLTGANNSVIYGDDNADSHMAFTISKQDCTTPR